MGATVAPIEVRPFHVVKLVMHLFLAVAQFSGIVEGTMNISPTDRGRAFVRPVAYVTPKVIKFLR